MSDTELLLRSELDRLFPAPVAQPDWQSVLRDAGVAARRPAGRRVAGLRDRKRLLIVAVVLVVLAIGGAAVAGTRGWGPFAGIAAANHAQKAQDVLDPAVVAQLSHRSPAGPRFVFGSSRVVRQFLDGRRIYVISTTKGDLCTVLMKNAKQLSSVGCGNPLTQTKPTTVTTEDLVVNGPNATTPLTYGIAQNGIHAVSFIAEGKVTSVPVKDNVWVYEGRNQALRSITVHYNNGSTQTLSH